MSDLLEKICPQTAASAAAPLSEERESARRQLQRFGLPGDRTEAWKYTSLRPLSMLDVQPTTSAPEAKALRQLAASMVADTPSAGIIVLAGNQCLLLDTPDWVSSFAELLTRHPDQAASLLQLRAGSDQAVMIEHSHVLQQASSSCRLWSLDTGGRLMRQEVRCALQGAAAGFAHHGLLLGHGRRHMDQHVMARHLAADCHSKQLFRCVLANRSRGVVNTAATVASGADGSDVQQHCASILLSANAEMDAKPQLEILADEVMASHGATIGQLDDDALFYLCSRGLSEQQARSMLLQGFVHAVLDTLPQALRIDAVDRVVQAQLESML
jgi:Fe-S cluster assembly protein SufD